MPQLDFGIFFVEVLFNFIFFWFLYFFLSKNIFPVINKSIKLRKYKIKSLNNNTQKFLCKFNIVNNSKKYICLDDKINYFNCSLFFLSKIHTLNNLNNFLFYNYFFYLKNKNLFVNICRLSYSKFLIK